MSPYLALPCRSLEQACLDTSGNQHLVEEVVRRVVDKLKDADRTTGEAIAEMEIVE